MGKIYQWNVVGLYKTDPNVAAEVMHGLAEQGKLNKKELVEVSRPEEAPLHKDFEWDNEVAAEKYREHQAQNMIHNLTVVSESVPEEPARRVFFNILSEGPKYETLETIMTRKDSVEALKKQCLKDLIAFKVKYQRILKACGCEEYTDAMQTRLELNTNTDGKEENENE